MNIGQLLKNKLRQLYKEDDLYVYFIYDMFTEKKINTLIIINSSRQLKFEKIFVF